MGAGWKKPQESTCMYSISLQSNNYKPFGNHKETVHLSGATSPQIQECLWSTSLECDRNAIKGVQRQVTKNGIKITRPG